jgi:hypothetical protein
VRSKINISIWRSSATIYSGLTECLASPSFKRHVAVDPDGRLLMVNLTTADSA